MTNTVRAFRAGRALTAQAAAVLGRAEQFGIRACPLDDVGDGWELVINGTSTGLGGTGDPVDVAAPQGVRCYDMLYSRNGDTPFCASAKSRGVSVVADGLRMLVEQAAEAFYLWRGVRPETAGVLARLREGAAT